MTTVWGLVLYVDIMRAKALVALSHTQPHADQQHIIST
jgi:hypothetical protein